MRITETPVKNITYQIGRKIQIPGCKEELLIEEIKDSDIVLQGLTCCYVLPKSYVERYNPPTNLEKLMTFKDKSAKIIEKTIFAMESFAVMAKQFGKLDMIYQDGVPKYIIKPHANIIIDPRENGYEHYGGTDNKYYPAFSRIKKLDYKIIDLDNPEQKEIIAKTMREKKEYIQTPNLRLDLFGSFGGLQYLEHHRIMAAMVVGLPITVNLKKDETYN